MKSKPSPNSHLQNISIFLIAIFAMVLTIVPFVSAAQLGLGLNLIVNSGTWIYIDSPPLYVDSAIVNASGCENTICLYNTSYTKGNLIVNTTGLINWTSGSIYSSAFPYLITDTTTNKNIASNLTAAANGSLTVTISSCNIKSLTYTPSESSSTSPSFSCNGNSTVTISNIQLNPATSGGNTIAISYYTSSQISSAPICNALYSGYGVFGNNFLIFFALLSIVVVVGIAGLILYATGTFDGASLGNIEISSVFDSGLFKGIMISTLVIVFLIVISILVIAQFCPT